jgi:hypothetical protein
VVLDGQLAVRALDGRVVRRLGHLQHVIVVFPARRRVSAATSRHNACRRPAWRRTHPACATASSSASSSSQALRRGGMPARMPAGGGSAGLLAQKREGCTFWRSVVHGGGMDNAQTVREVHELLKRQQDRQARCALAAARDAPR